MVIRTFEVKDSHFKELKELIDTNNIAELKVKYNEIKIGCVRSLTCLKFELNALERKLKKSYGINYNRLVELCEDDLLEQLIAQHPDLNRILNLDSEDYLSYNNIDTVNEILNNYFSIKGETSLPIVANCINKLYEACFTEPDRFSYTCCLFDFIIRGEYTLEEYISIFYTQSGIGMEDLDNLLYKAFDTAPQYSTSYESDGFVGFNLSDDTEEGLIWQNKNKVFIELLKSISCNAEDYLVDAYNTVIQRLQDEDLSKKLYTFISDLNDSFSLGMSQDTLDCYFSTLD